MTLYDHVATYRSATVLLAYAAGETLPDIDLDDDIYPSVESAKQSRDSELRSAEASAAGHPTLSGTDEARVVAIPGHSSVAVLPWGHQKRCPRDFVREMGRHMRELTPVSDALAAELAKRHAMSGDEIRRFVDDRLKSIPRCRRHIIALAALMDDSGRPQ